MVKMASANKEKKPGKTEAKNAKLKTILTQYKRPMTKVNK
jgi:hypothetical protein